jgi:hypothetical protein
MGLSESVVLFLIIVIIGCIIAKTLIQNENIRKILSVIVLVLVIILVIYIIYELYQFIKKVRKNSPTLLSKSVNASKSKVYEGKLLPPSNIGSEYSYSFWVYVDDWNYKYDSPKHILSRGSDPSKDTASFVCNPGIWFYPKSTNLVIRFDTYGRAPNYSYLPGQELMGQAPTGGTTTFQDITKAGCQSKCDMLNTCAGFSLNKKTGQCFLKDSPYSGGKSDKKCETYQDCGSDNVCNNGVCGSNVDSYSKTMSMMPTAPFDDSNEICDIINLPIQRWVHVGVVLWNRTTDIYLNGKLRRSCILKGVPKVPWGSDLYQTQNGGFAGKIAQLRYFNRALNATEMYKIYTKGPLHWNLLQELLDIVPKISVSASVSVDK